jgi:hypothetical protein
MKINLEQVSISPMFYPQLLRTLVVCAAFLCLCFRFVLYWRKPTGAKAECRMLMKLILGLHNSSPMAGFYCFHDSYKFFLNTFCFVNLYLNAILKFHYGEAVGKDGDGVEGGLVHPDTCFLMFGL